MLVYDLLKINMFNMLLFSLRVLVMGDGEVLEFEEPNLLIQNIDSYFYHLVSQEFSDNE